MPKVMIIDDDRIMVSLLTTLLQMDGFEVVNANPHESIPLRVRAENPDLVLMDVFLTGADGIEVLSELRAEPELSNVRVVMTSGMDVGDRCTACGADAFLLKPYTPDQLMATIRGNLAGLTEAVPAQGPQGGS